MPPANSAAPASRASPHLEPCSRGARLIGLGRGTAPRSLAVAVGLLVTGLLVTGFTAIYIAASVEAGTQREFDFACNEIRLNVAARFVAHAQILRSGAALFDATERVTREEWRAFTQGLQVEPQLPGIQGIGFAVLIPRAQLAQHVQAIRREGFPNYQIRPAGEREAYSAIIYLEPFSDRNLRAFGYDMFSEPVRRVAMERARDANIAALSGKVRLVQETDQDVQAGTLMYVPVYAHGLPRDTREQRRAALQGWVYSPYRMTDLMRGTLRGWEAKSKAGEFCLQIYDGEVLSAETLLYDSQSAGEPPQASTAGVTRLSPVDVGGRRWTLRFTQFGGLASAASYGSVWLAVYGGTTISLLLFGLALSWLNTRTTSQRIAERLTTELRESEGRFTQLAEQSRTFAWEVDSAGLYTYVSHISESVLGYHPNELVGRLHFYDLHPATGRAEFRQGVLAAFQRKEPMVDFLNAVETKDGRRLWVSTNGIPLLNADGTLRGYRGSDTDSTERKRAEETLRGVTERLLLATRAGGVGIWDYDVVHNTLVWDKQMFQLYGITPAAFGGGYAAWQAGVHPEDVQRGDEEIQQALRGEQDFDTEFRVLWPDGSTHTIRALALVQRDEAGQPLHMIGTNWDITESKRAEEQLREANRQLQTAMVHAQELTVQAQTANTAKSEFLANMSHEIRTPMNAILGFSEMLLAEGVCSQEQRVPLELIQRAGNNLLELINQILDLARIEAEKLILVQAACDVEPLVAEVLSLVRVQAEAKGLRLQLSCEPTLPKCLYTDAARLRQILTNLLGNAVKFTDHGEVRLTLCRRASGNGPADLQFAVVDTGIGIPADKLGQLFQPFMQVDGSLNRRYGGTGLGLVISRRLAQALGGELEVVSEIGRGSTFTLTLPAEQRLPDDDRPPDRSTATVEQLSQAASPAEPSPIRLDQQPEEPAESRLEQHPTGVPATPRQYRVLCVEDDPHKPPIVRYLLRPLRLDLDFVAGGQQAGELVEQSLAEGRSYDLILLDLQSSQGNGYAAIQCLRKQGWTGPMVGITAHSLPGDREQCLAAGCDDYLSQSFSGTRLQDLVVRCLTPPGSESSERFTAQEAERTNPTDFRTRSVRSTWNKPDSH